MSESLGFLFSILAALKSALFGTEISVVPELCCSQFGDLSTKGSSNHLHQYLIYTYNSGMAIHVASGFDIAVLLKGKLLKFFKLAGQSDPKQAQWVTLDKQ